MSFVSLLAYAWLLVPSALPAPQESGATLVVLNKSGDTAWLVDPESGERRAEVETGRAPHEVAIDPDGRRAVVTNYEGGSLTLIDLERAEVSRTIDLGDYRRPHGVVFHGPDRVLVTGESKRALLEVDLDEGEIVRAIPTGAAVSHMVARAPDGRRAFVANIGSGSVSVIDLEKGELVATVETGAGCEGIAVRPFSGPSTPQDGPSQGDPSQGDPSQGYEVWASNREADTLSILDGENLEVVQTLETPSFPIRLVFTPDGGRALVSCAAADELAVYDAAERRLIGKVPMELEPVEGSEGYLFGRAFAQRATPIGVLVEPSGRRAFVAATNSDLVAVVDLEALAVQGTIAAGRQPDGLGWAGGSR